MTFSQSSIDLVRPLHKGEAEASRFLTRGIFLTFTGSLLLGVLHAHLRVAERSEGIRKHRAGTEVDFGTLDEVGGVLFLAEGTLAAEGKDVPKA